MTAADDREYAARVSDITEAIVDSVRAGDDLGDVLSYALGMVANRVGGIERMLARRPGSWEADHVRRLAEQYVTHPV